MTWQPDEALADALGQVVSGLRKEWRRELEIIAAESRALIAELRAENADLRAQLKVGVDDELARIVAAQAAVRDGRDGKDGADGAPGRNGVDGKDGAPGRDGIDGAPGKDIDPAAVREMVAAEVKQAVPIVDDFVPAIEAAAVKAVAAIPVPRDGTDGAPGQDGADGKDADLELTRALIVKEVAEHLAAIPRPQDGRDGRDGKDADWVAIERQISVAVKHAVAEIPAPRDGRDGTDGRDGKSIDHAEIKQMIADAVVTIPHPKDGADGSPGRDGMDGKSVTVDDVAPLIEAEVERRIKAIPAPQDGRDGRDGKDGVGLSDALIGGDGGLNVVFSDGRVKHLGAGFAKDINEAALAQMISDAAADLHKGIWESRAYRKGDWVTYGGSIFKAEADTDQRPTASDDWRLVLKRGRDGKDAETPKLPRPAVPLPPKDGE